MLAHLHLHSDPFAWQAPCIHHVVAETAGLEADLELVVDAAAEAVGLGAGLELAVWDVADQDVGEAIFEVVAAKEVVVGTEAKLAAALEAAVEFEAADEELDLVTVVVGTAEEVAAAEAEHFLFHETIVGVVGVVKVAQSVAVVEVLVLGPVDDVG